MATANFLPVHECVDDFEEGGGVARPEELARCAGRRRALLVLGVGACVLAVVALSPGDPSPIALTARVTAAIRGYDYQCMPSALEEYRARKGVCTAAKEEAQKGCSGVACRPVYAAFNDCVFAAYDCYQGLTSLCHASTVGASEPSACQTAKGAEPPPTTTTLQTTTVTTVFSESDCVFEALRFSQQRERVCKQYRADMEERCATQKKAQECKSEGYTIVDRCNRRKTSCKEAMKRECSNGKRPDLDNIESCQDAEEPTVVESGEQVELSGGQVYKFYSLASCPTGIFCNNGLDGMLDPPRIINRDDQVPSHVRLDAAEKDGEFYLVQDETCRYRGQMCNFTLAAGTQACPQAWSHEDYSCQVAIFTHSHTRATSAPFKAVRVEGKNDQFYFVNQLGCPDGPQCDWYLSMDSENCVHKAPKVVIERLPEAEREIYGRWRLVPVSPIPVPVDVVDGNSYNIYTMDLKGCFHTDCNHAIYAPSQDPMVYSGEFGTPTAYRTPFRFEATENPDEYILRQTTDCWWPKPRFCGQGLGFRKSSTCDTSDDNCQRVLLQFTDDAPVPFKVAKDSQAADVFFISAAHGTYTGWQMVSLADGRLAIATGSGLVAEDLTVWRLEVTD